MKFKVYLFRNDVTSEIAIIASSNVSNAMSLLKGISGSDIESNLTGIADLGASYESSNPEDKDGVILYNSFDIIL